ncbi:MAG: hypothetical protein Q3993_07215 [Filifactor alocis]|nr:hypothetical protein [Filifactor alocis]
MDYRDKDGKDKKDKIVSLNEMRQRREQEELERKEVENSNEVLDKMVDVLFSNMDESLKDQLKSMLSSYGMKLDEKEKREVEAMLDSKQLKEMAKEFLPEDLSELGGDAKREKMKELNRQSEIYRDILQWRRAYKPYTLDKFVLYNDMQKLCEEVGLKNDRRLTMQEMISALKPRLQIFLQSQMRYYDDSRMNCIATLVQHNGVYHLEHSLNEIEEWKTDYFESKFMVFRVLDSGVKTLVMPKELLEELYRMDLTEYNLLTQINTTIVKFVIGLANTYGVYSLERAIKEIFPFVQRKYSQKWTSFEEFEDHVRKLVKHSFGNLFLLKSYYPGINVSSSYIYHGTVGFAEQFLEMQEQYPCEYKSFETQDILESGSLHYYEESIQLNMVIESLKKHNDLTQKDEKHLKNVIYVFSKFEFKPNTVVLFLESMYHLPEGEEFDKLLGLLSKLNEATPKWLLKGHYMGEQKDYEADTSKIINIDFRNRGVRDDE